MRSSLAPSLFALVLALASLPGPGWGQPEEAAAPAGPETADRLFTEANRLFNGGETIEELQRSASLYRELLRRGHRSADIHYNLGCAYLRMQETGRAILHFRRALLHDPAHAYALSMLQSARDQVEDRFESTTARGISRTLFFWHFESSRRSRVTALTAAWCGFWLLLIAGLFTRVPLARTALAALGLATVTLAGSVIIETLERRGREAVIVAPEVEVRKSHGESFDPVLQAPVSSGVEGRILETRNLWHQVELPGGVVGWVPAPAAEAIREPGTGGKTPQVFNDDGG